MVHVPLYLILHHIIKAEERVNILLKTLLISTLLAGKQMDSSIDRFNPAEMAAECTPEQVWTCWKEKKKIIFR
jgi:hypothetical protein